MLRIDPLALISGLREFVNVVYGPIVTHVFPDVQVEAYRYSVLYVNLVSVVVCFKLAKRELRGLASEDRLFGRITEPGWVLMDLNNNSKCRMCGENLSNVQFNPILWNLRAIIRGTKEAVKIPVWPETYAHVKENQDTWLAGSDPLPDMFPLYPHIRRMLLGVTRIELRKTWRRGCSGGAREWSRASSVGTLQPCIHLNLPFLTYGVQRRLKPYHPGSQRYRQAIGTMCMLQLTTSLG